MDLSAIRINIKADTNEAKNSLESLKKTGESIAKVGTALTVGLTVPILGAGTASLMVAANVGEMESKFNTVFKSTSKSVEEWANTYSNAIGRSRYELMEAVSNQADLMIGMGMTEQVAGDLSTKYTELAYDLASFNNVNDKTAVEAMTKAMMGETEMAKQLGLNLSETVMASSEYVKSTGKSWKEMNMAEKAQARYHEALKQSTNALGDAERTQASFTNQMKRMKGLFNEVGVEIGKVILPVAEKLITAFNKLLGSVLNLVKENPEFARSIVLVGGALAALGPGLLIVGKLMTLCAKFTFLVPIFAGVTAGITAIGISFVGTNESAQKFITELPQKLISGLNGMLSGITEKLPEMTAKGLEIINNFIDGIVTGIPFLLAFASEMVVGLLDTFFSYMPTFLQTGIDFILNILGGLVQAFPELINGVINATTDLLFRIWNRMPEFLQTGIDFVKNMLDGFIQKFPELLQNVIDGIFNILANIRSKMPEFLKNGIEFVANMISGIAQNLPSIIAKMGELLASLISKIVENLPKFLAEGAKIVVEIVKGLWNNKGQLVQIGADLITALWNSCVEGVKSFLSIGTKIVDSIKNGIANAWGSLTGWLSNKIKSIPIVGNLFKSMPAQEEGIEAVPVGFEQLTRMPFSELNKEIGLEPSSFIKFKEKELKLLKNNSLEKQKKTDTVKEINITIENFVNNTKEDINVLMEKITFEMQRRKLC